MFPSPVAWASSPHPRALGSQSVVSTNDLGPELIGSWLKDKEWENPKRARWICYLWVLIGVGVGKTRLAIGFLDICITPNANEQPLKVEKPANNPKPIKKTNRSIPGWLHQEKCLQNPPKKQKKVEQSVTPLWHLRSPGCHKPPPVIQEWLRHPALPCPLPRGKNRRGPPGASHSQQEPYLESHHEPPQLLKTKDDKHVARSVKPRLGRFLGFSQEWGSWRLLHFLQRAEL